MILWTKWRSRYHFIMIFIGIALLTNAFSKTILFWISYARSCVCILNWPDLEKLLSQYQYCWLYLPYDHRFEKMFIIFFFFFEVYNKHINVYGLNFHFLIWPWIYNGHSIGTDFSFRSIENYTSFMLIHSQDAFSNVLLFYFHFKYLLDVLR